MLGGGAVLAGESAYLAGRQPASWWGAPGTAAVSRWPDSPRYVPCYPLAASGYTPDGTAGHTAAYPLAAVRLLASPFRANQARNLDYLLFLDPERMLHTFRLNYGRPSPARPAGGWEAPNMQVRGHTTGHLLSGLALSYASTGDPRAKAAGEYLVGQLAQLQSIAPLAGYAPGYLSAFPEYYFDWLEAGQRVWSPYYMIHKYLAGMIDQYELAGAVQALDVATRLADWVDARTSRLSYARMQAVLENEFGGLPEALANLYRITGSERYLRTAERFYHARFLDPLAAGDDLLDGQQCNVSIPKVIACVRMWEETGDLRYRAIAENFWQIAARHHTYVIGGQGDHEHWGPPDVVAGALSNYTCEGCVTYNMLKLTRLLHFHDLARVDLLDYYERALFNQMLGTQDPESPHGFVCYYTGLSAGAFKQQPMNYFPRGDPDVYATDYDTFTCDNATGLETQAKFADTVYSRDQRGVYVNLFIPSEVRCADQGITLRQTTGFPDDPVVRLTVLHGSAPMILRVRVPSWAAAAPTVVLNGTELHDVVLPAGSDAVLSGLPASAGGSPHAAAAGGGGWVVVNRHWRPGDWLEVTLPMRLALAPAPDDPAVQAVTYGPVVLSGLYGASYATAPAAAGAAADSAPALPTPAPGPSPGPSAPPRPKTPLAPAPPLAAGGSHPPGSVLAPSGSVVPDTSTMADSSLIPGSSIVPDSVLPPGSSLSLSATLPSQATSAQSVTPVPDTSAAPGAATSPGRPPLASAPAPERIPVPGLGTAGEVIPPLPVLDPTSIRRTAAQPMTFEATADGQRITMVPVARAQHEPFTVYWRTP